VSDRQLLQRAQGHDLQALAEIYDRWSPALYRYAIRLLGEADLAEECVADTFSRFLAALGQGKGPKDFLNAYLYRVAHNWISDYYRRRPPQELPLEPELHAGGEGEPHEHFTLEVERQQLQVALSRITPDQRQVLILKYVEEWDNRDIARALGRPVGAIKALQHRALESLRRSLKAEWEGLSDETE
jgi:RNA polymerase sigma-70 factor (ECF subfamily)